MRGLEGYGARIAAGCMVWIGHFAGGYAAWQVVMDPGTCYPSDLHPKIWCCCISLLHLCASASRFGRGHLLYIVYCILYISYILYAEPRVRVLGIERTTHPDQMTITLVDNGVYGAILSLLLSFPFLHDWSVLPIMIVR